jgi:signal peptide peptidase SppA
MGWRSEGYGNNQEAGGYMSIQRFFNTPIALARQAEWMVLEALRSEGLAYAPNISERSERRLYEVVNCIAVIPICGILVHGSAMAWWNETDYRSICAAINAAVADGEVKAIALHVNSPGGEVAGCFDLAETIFNLRGSKPIWAILDESAYSAAYALASSADKIIVPKTGGTGSIGVVTMHMDVTAALEQMGIKMTTIQFGERKTDSYPTTPLSGDALARIQADVDEMGNMFVDLVARNRGLSSESVRATQAGTFLGKFGVEQGLADAVMPPDQAFLALLNEIN